MKHLYGPDVRRTDDSYRDVFLPDILPDALRRINRNLPEAAVEEAIRKIQNVEIGSLEQRNEIFNDYLQSGVEVHFFDGKEERDDIVRLLDFDDPENNDFHVVNQWTFVEYSEKRPDVIIFVNGMPVGVVRAEVPVERGDGRFTRVPAIAPVHEADTEHVRAQRVLRDERYDPDQGRHDHIRRGPLRGLEVGGRRLFRNESRGMEHHD